MRASEVAMIGLHHVGRTVADLDATARDLAAITTWPSERLSGVDDPFVAGRDVVATVRASGPNGWIELVGVDGVASTRREVNEPGVTHAAVQVPQIDDVVRRLDCAGIDRHPGPVALGTGFHYLYVRDAEQLIIEVEGAPHAPAELGPWLGHGAIATPDIDVLRAAYEALLATTATDTVRVRGHAEFDRAAALSDIDVTATWVPTGNAAIEMWQYHHPATRRHPATRGTDRQAYEQPGNGHLAFETDDVDTALARAEAADFEIVDQPMMSDGVEIARLLDPDGNWIEILRCHDLDDIRSLRSRPDIGRVDRMNALLARSRS